MSDAIPKAELFASLGYGPPHEPLDEALEEAGLSRSSKANISAAKEAPARAVLRERFFAVCGRGDCLARAEAEAGGRRVQPAASQADCGICGGSPTERAVGEMIAAWERAGLRRLCVVGGSPTAHRELEAIVAGRLELRLVDGTTSRRATDARSDLAWADRVAVWGGTILSHKVSKLYKGPHVVQFAKRSIGELAAEMSRSAEG